MRFYQIGLGIWIFMLILSMINSLGIFQLQMPASDLNATTGEAKITELTTNAATSQSKEDTGDIVGGIGMMLSAMSYMKEAFIDSIHIMGIAHKYGIDDRISAPFEAILLFIYGFGMYQFITGRGTKIME
jgi:proteasome assembly chaperone (PAC2) family protein